MSNIPTTPEKALRAQASFLDLTEYFRNRLDVATEHADDFVGICLHNRPKGVATELVLAQFSALLFGAYRTTSHWLGNSLYTLLRHPDQWQQVSEQPDLLRPALVEILRYEPPLPFIVRTVRETHQRHGQILYQGQTVYLLLAAANRDPDKFTKPDSLDIHRHEGPQLSFGLGSHGCIGATLAYLEVETAFQIILRRFPNIKLVNRSANWHESWQLRGLKTLPISIPVLCDEKFGNK
jgi:cytochrome P450